MTLAAVGAVGIGAYAEGAWVLVLFAVGTTLETYALDRSRRSVGELMELAPEQARVVPRTAPSGSMPVEEVDRRRALRSCVRASASPLDGEVVAGASSVDEAPITGESVPVDKAPGDAVFAGTLNAQGALTVRATHGGRRTRRSRASPRSSRRRRARARRRSASSTASPASTRRSCSRAALAVAVVPVALFGGDVDTWVYRALALLIVACPCSLVISIPVAVVSAVGARRPRRRARQGRPGARGPRARPDGGASTRPAR